MACCSSYALRRLGHEDDVDVADVVELVAAALAHRDRRRAGRTCAASPTLARATASAASSVPAARSDELGGDVVDAEVVGEVAGGEPQQQPSVLHPQRVAAPRACDSVATGLGVVGVGADGTEQRRRSGRTPEGGSSPASGRSSSCQWSGWRRRCSPSAWLAPSTESSRIEVPSSSATSCEQRGRGRRPRRRARPGPPAPGRDRRCGRSAGRCGAATSPRVSSRVPRPVGVEEPEPHQLALRDVTSSRHPANLPKPRRRGS